MAKKQKTREEVKADLLKKCRLTFADKDLYRWLSTNANEMLSPKCVINVDNHIFRLRYLDNYDTPFEEEQPTNLPVRLKRINILDNELTTSSKEQALNMFLLLNPANIDNGGNRYRLENREKESAQVLQNYELKDEAANKIRTSDLEDAKAALFVLTAKDTMSLSSSEIRLELRNIVEYNPQNVIDAFNDEKTAIKFKYFTAIKLGYLVTNLDETTLRWDSSNKIFFTVPLGENMADNFAEFCLSNKGKEVLELLYEKLLK